MADLLTWTDRALADYDNLQEYLFEEWGEEIAQRVINEITQTVYRIQNNPEHFPIVIKRKNIRKCVASPQTSIFFKASKQKILIITLFDNRQNPKKRRL